MSKLYTLEFKHFPLSAKGCRRFTEAYAPITIAFMEATCALDREGFGHWNTALPELLSEVMERSSDYRSQHPTPEDLEFKEQCEQWEKERRAENENWEDEAQTEPTDEELTGDIGIDDDEDDWGEDPEFVFEPRDEERPEEDEPCSLTITFTNPHLIEPILLVKPLYPRKKPLDPSYSPEMANLLSNHEQMFMTMAGYNKWECACNDFLWMAAGYKKEHKRIAIKLSNGFTANKFAAAAALIVMYCEMAVEALKQGDIYHALGQLEYIHLLRRAIREWDSKAPIVLSLNSKKYARWRVYRNEVCAEFLGTHARHKFTSYESAATHYLYWLCQKHGNNLQIEVTTVRDWIRRCAKENGIMLKHGRRPGKPSQ
jgi:hypothetical protein